jgi:hypothetical protein
MKCKICGEEKIYCKGICEGCYNENYYRKNKDKLCIRQKIYVLNHKEEKITYDKLYREKNKLKIMLYQKEYRQKNKEKLIDLKKRYYQNHKVEIFSNVKLYTKNHKENITIYQKDYRQKNRPMISLYKINKYHTDINYKISCLLRNYTNFVMKEKYKKSKFFNTIELLGCSIEEFTLYLEKLFKPGMSWKNYGRNGWHLDHIIPCAHFILSDPEQQKLCFHYTNLQPMWAKENLIKGAQIEE